MINSINKFNELNVEGLENTFGGKFNGLKCAYGIGGGAITGGLTFGFTGSKFGYWGALVGAGGGAIGGVLTGAVAACF